MFNTPEDAPSAGSEIFEPSHFETEFFHPNNHHKIGGYYSGTPVAADSHLDNELKVPLKIYCDFRHLKCVFLVI